MSTLISLASGQAGLVTLLFSFLFLLANPEEGALQARVSRSAVSMVGSGISGLVTFRARQAIEDADLRYKLDLWVGSQGLGCLKIFPVVKASRGIKAAR